MLKLFVNAKPMNLSHKCEETQLPMQRRLIHLYELGYEGGQVHWHCHKPIGIFGNG